MRTQDETNQSDGEAETRRRIKIKTPPSETKGCREIQQPSSLREERAHKQEKTNGTESFDIVDQPPPSLFGMAHVLYG